jgi:hypothetical protein
VKLIAFAIKNRLLRGEKNTIWSKAWTGIKQKARGDEKKKLN